jgi:hypothetical protein
MISRTDSSRPINSDTGWGRFDEGADGDRPAAAWI